MPASASDGAQALRVLVTGATGTVGRRVVADLLEGGHKVRALTRDPSRASLPDGVEVVTGDLTDPGSLDGVFDGIDAAHLFAVDAQAVADPQECAEGILRHAAEAGVRRVTVLDGVGTVPLGAVATAAGGTVIAPVEFMAHALWWAEALHAGIVREPFASSRSTVVHEADIAAVIAAVLTASDGSVHAGRTITVTGPEALSVHERVAILAGVIGRPLRVEEPTRDEAVAQWRSWGLDEDVVAQFLAWASDPPASAVIPVDTVERVTGRPGRTFREWASEHVDAFR